MSYTPPGLALIAQSELIKQGAEGRVYINDSLFGTPSIYWPEPGPPASSSALGSGPTDPAAASSSSSAAASINAPSASSSPENSGTKSSKGRPTSATTSLRSANDCSPLPVIIKHRFPKTYRHPALDASLTRTRLQFEARSLWRCSRLGLAVPQVYFVDESCGCLGLEKVEGWSVREVLGGGAEGELELAEEIEVEQPLADLHISSSSSTADGQKQGSSGEGQEEGSKEGEEETDGLKALKSLGQSTEDLMRKVGKAIGLLHTAGIVHGDLTTSNMMLTPQGSVVLIDFGLSSQASMPEHYAVDLYVLERAFASTHPRSEGLFKSVLDAYGETVPQKKWKSIETKLKEVRLRGRKRDMTG